MKNDIERPCLRDILILLSAALILGIYLIATTVVISRDGVLYIERAQEIPEDIERAQGIPEDTAGLLAWRPYGYERMISSSHRIVNAITGDCSLQGWIWTGQGVALLCRLGALTALYWAGCRVAGRKNSFWGCLILLLLPETAYMGSDVLREWPNFLFMSLVYLSLFYGVGTKSPWPFALAGLFGGGAFLIRPESALLVFLAALIPIVSIIKPTAEHTRTKALIGIVLLVTGFAGTVLVYAGFSGQLRMNDLKQSQNKASGALTGSDAKPMDTQTAKALDDFDEEIHRIKVDKSLPLFAYELFKDVGELLVWFFFPFWVIGIGRRLYNKAGPAERIVTTGLIVIGIGLILFRYWFNEPVVSVRWLVPILVLTVFYIPAGIEQVALWAERKKMQNLQNPEKWRRILLAVGIGVCLIQTVEPLGSDKRVFLEAAQWIHQNTKETDAFYSFDRRIPFYAERDYFAYDLRNEFFDPGVLEYLIIPAKGRQPTIGVPEGAVLEAGFSRDGEELLIYRHNP